jgi:hypothetical protein
MVKTPAGKTGCRNLVSVKQQEADECLIYGVCCEEMRKNLPVNDFQYR